MILTSLLAFAVPQEPLTPEVLYQRVLPSVVALTVERNDGAKVTGTGFLALRDGCAVTAFHLIRQAKKVTARFSDGQEFDVSGWIDSDAKRDVALVKVKAADRPLLGFTGADPAVGSKAFVVGSPRGLDFSMSDGLIGQVRTLDGFKQYQFTCPASPGNSGGPLIASDGSVLGVVSWQVVNGQNLNFAIPNGYVRGLDHTLPTKPWDHETLKRPTEAPGAPAANAAMVRVFGEAIANLHEGAISFQTFLPAYHDLDPRVQFVERMGRIEDSVRFIGNQPDEADPTGVASEFGMVMIRALEAGAVAKRLVTVGQGTREEFDVVLGELSGRYRLCEISPKLREDLLRPENAALKEAIPPRVLFRMLASPQQKGWRDSSREHRDGLPLLARLAFDVDRTGYVFGFVVSPSDPAKLETADSDYPPRGWGFAKGDIVKSVDGEPVDSIEAMKEKLIALAKPAKVVVLRKDKEVTLKVDIRRYLKG